MGETLTFAPRKVIKSQVLADFVAEWTDTQLPPTQIQTECWTLYFDGSLMKTGAGAGLLFISPLGVHMRYMVRLHFATSNNMAEYEALINGLQVAIELGARRLDVRGDSRLVIDQVMKESNCLDPKMEAYCKLVRRLEDKFDGLELNHVARKYNEAADELAKMASARAPVPPNVFARDLHKPSIGYTSTTEEGPPMEPAAELDAPYAAETPSTKPEVMEVNAEPPRTDQDADWRVPFLDWLDRGELPDDRTKARWLARRAKTYALYNDELYRRSPSGVLQRCISSEAGQALLWDLHVGACGHHATPRTLVGNAFRQGFYWPTAVADATKLVRSC